MTTVFYICETCGNIITKLKDSGIKPFCCGRSVTELHAQKTESEAGEKHIPVCCIKDGKVHIKVGSTEHPHTPEHYIQWIYLETDKGMYVRYLTDNEVPGACFTLSEGEKVKAVYIYCNIHGLWMCDCTQGCNDKTPGMSAADCEGDC